MVNRNPASQQDIPSQGDVVQCRNGNGWPLLISLLALGLISVLAFFLGKPPEPLPIDAPLDQFSALRADGYLEHLVSDGIPHPAGSDQNRIVRDKITALLKSFGYQVHLQETEAQIRRTRSAVDPETVPLCNIMARLQGASDEPAIMLVTHFDSVPYGPGASDDGVGVASMLEVARMLKKMDPPQRSVILLFTDGEEYGLLGAKKFVEHHPWANDVGWLINLEARGTKGPSILFETGSESVSLIREFANVSRRPIASSLFFEIYKQLPNDTDFTVFKKHGMQGFNFAFIGDVKNYHTPNDSFATVNQASFQHHGENMWRLVSRLAYLEKMPPPQGQAVYFDVFGRLLIWWPASWSVWMTLCGGLVGAGSGWICFKRKEVSVNSLLIASGCFLLVCVVLLLMGWLCDFGLRRDGRLDNPWPQYPLPMILSFWLLGLVTAAALSLGLGRLGTPSSHWLIVCFTWLVAALLTSIYLPGASYLFIVPALVAVVSQFVLRNLLKISMGVVSGLSIVAVGVIWIPMEPLFYDAVGFRINQILILRVAVVMTVIWPLLVWTRSGIVWWTLVTSSLLLIGFLLTGFFMNPVT